jgi:hypothetical protein
MNEKIRYLMCYVFFCDKIHCFINSTKLKYQIFYCRCCEYKLYDTVLNFLR